MKSPSTCLLLVGLFLAPCETGWSQAARFDPTLVRNSTLPTSEVFFRGGGSHGGGFHGGGFHGGGVRRGGYHGGGYRYAGGGHRYGYRGRYGYGRYGYGGYGRGYGYGAGAAVAAGVAGAAVGAAVASQGNSANYCASRYRSYDPSSGTYLGNDGLRHPCQ